MKKRNAQVLMSGAILFLAGCATQAPAPIVDGFQKTSPAPTWVKNSKTQEEQPAYTYVHSKSIFDEPQTYLVQPGDNIAQIARHFRVSSSELAARNNVKENTILSVGQVLIIPAGEEDSGSSYQVQNDRVTEKLQNAVVAPPKTQQAAEPAKLTDRVANTTEHTTATQPAAPVQEKLAERQVGFVHHKVKKGENLFRIGLKYDVSVLDLMNMNQLEKPEDLQADFVLKVPTLRQPTARVQVQNTEAVQKQGLVWPVRGKVIKSFGQKSTGVNHTGINIQAKHGTPVAAAASGSVIYASGGLKSYGNLILLRHADGLITAYAHNAQNLVKKNDYVQRGQIIAYVGETGNVSEPQLHFEVRRNAQALNPITVLPR